MVIGFFILFVIAWTARHRLLLILSVLFWFGYIFLMGLSEVFWFFDDVYVEAIHEGCVGPPQLFMVVAGTIFLASVHRLWRVQTSKPL